MVDLLRTTGSARSFTTDPVPPEVLYAVLDTARFAPSGGNRQPWKVAVVEDVALRRGIGALIRRVVDDYYSRPAGVTPFNPVDDVVPATVGRGDYPLVDQIEDVPVVLAVAADLRRIALMDGILARPALTGGASIYPFCWNLLLAARAHGLGGVLTTFLSRVEPEAAPLLGLPEHHALAATIFLGYPQFQPSRLKRNPVEAFATVDRFDGPTFRDRGWRR